MPFIVNQLDNKQFAMAGKSTQQAIVYILHLALKALDKSGCAVRFFFADFRKGFDLHFCVRDLSLFVWDTYIVGWDTYIHIWDTYIDTYTHTSFCEAGEINTIEKKYHDLREKYSHYELGSI